jgi:hypothetical protein
LYHCLKCGPIFCHSHSHFHHHICILDTPDNLLLLFVDSTRAGGYGRVSPPRRPHFVCRNEPPHGSNSYSCYKCFSRYFLFL